MPRRVTIAAALCGALLAAACRAPEPAPEPTAVRLGVDLRINEVAFAPEGDEAEWVEVYNAGAPLRRASFTLLGTNGRLIAEVEDVDIPRRGHLVVRFAAGPASTSPAPGDVVEVFTGSDSAVLGNEAGGVELLAEGRLLRDDFRGTATRTQKFLDAVSWRLGAARDDETSFTDEVFPTVGSSLGRNGVSADTGRPSDWFGGGGVHALAPTPGRANIDPDVAYELQAGASAPCSPPASGRLDGLRALVEKVLKQIRKEHTGEFVPVDLLDAGFRDWDGETIASSKGNEVKADNVVVKVCTGLRGEGGMDAGGLTPFPSGKDTPADAWVVLVDADNFAGLVDSEHRLKDILVHELVHVALNRNTSKGAWRDVGGGRFEPATRGNQQRVRACHEALAYQVNLRLLQALAAIPDQPADALTWKSRRIAEKTKLLKAHLDECLDALRAMKGALAGVRAELAKELAAGYGLVDEKLRAQASTPGQQRAVDLYMSALGDALESAGAQRPTPPPTPPPSPPPSPSPAPSPAPGGAGTAGSDATQQPAPTQPAPDATPLFRPSPEPLPRETAPPR